LRLARLSLAALAVLTVGTPLADATVLTPYPWHFFTLDGFYAGQAASDTFVVTDPGGAFPAACYHRTLALGALDGSIVVRVFDARGDLVFVDPIVGFDFGAAGQAVGFAGFTPGTWRLQILAYGEASMATLGIEIQVASDASLC